MQIEDLTTVPGKYSWSPVEKDEFHWQTIPRNIAIKVYQHYFVDFGKIKKRENHLRRSSVLYGYSPEDAMRFINASNQQLHDDHELFEQSRQNLQKFKRKNNYDFLC